ncbi:MAG: SDR family NAD(P)-dependent oxidoreductase [Chloroflexota bacterium]
MVSGRLAGRTAVITGGASGLGLATARLFASEGAALILADWDGTALDLASDSLRTTGYEIVPIPGDVSDATTSREIVDTARSRFGRLDVLFNNAGIDPLRARSVTNTAEADWDRVMAVNIKSAYLLSSAALPLMIKGGGGSIVNTASIAGLRASADEAAYSVSKAAMISLTQSLARDYAHHGVRANCICPGMMEMVMTDRRRDMREDQLANREAAANRTVPMGRQGTYAEIAQAVLFLAGPESSYVTGAALVVDGGLSLV